MLPYCLENDLLTGDVGLEAREDFEPVRRFFRKGNELQIHLHWVAGHHDS